MPCQRAMWVLRSGLGAATLLVSIGALAAPEASSPATSLARAAGAPPQSENACLALHESAQEERLGGELLKAREMLRECTNADCPSLVRADCATLLAEVERVVPTVLFELQNPELDPARVRATVVGPEARALAFSVPLEFDAGSLTVRFEAPGYVPLEQTLIVREGEKNRLVPVRLSLPPPPPLPLFPPSLAETRPRRPAPTPTQRASRSRLLGYVLGGVAVGAAATSTYFAVSALDRRANARRRCAPLCSQRESDAIAKDLLAADLTGGVAVLALGVSVTLLVLDEPVADPSVARAKGARGYGASIGGSFQ